MIFTIHSSDIQVTIMIFMRHSGVFIRLSGYIQIKNFHRKNNFAIFFLIFTAQKCSSKKKFYLQKFFANKNFTPTKKILWTTKFSAKIKFLADKFFAKNKIFTKKNFPRKKKFAKKNVAEKKNFTEKIFLQKKNFTKKNLPKIFFGKIFFSVRNF